MSAKFPLTLFEDDAFLRPTDRAGPASESVDWSINTIYHHFQACMCLCLHVIGKHVRLNYCWCSRKGSCLEDLLSCVMSPYSFSSWIFTFPMPSALFSVHWGWVLISTDGRVRTANEQLMLIVIKSHYCHNGVPVVKNKASASITTPIPHQLLPG